MKRHIKKILIGVSVLLAAMILIAVGYVIYVAASYSRMEDNLPLAALGEAESHAKLNEEYEVLTYNIGFGAYTPSYSFFMDSGVMTDGKKVKGKYGKGESKEAVRRNVYDGIVPIIGNLFYDFVFAQEVDEDGDRSYHINERELITNSLGGYDSVYGCNFHSPYLYYPFSDPHGKNKSGILTLSRFEISEAVRRSLPVPSGIDKYFDLDRCYTVSRLNIEGSDKQLALINVHLSAYDKGGTVRAKQLEMLSAALSVEYEKGNYVLVGGDFNHDICSSIGTFATRQQKPDWVRELSGNELPVGFRFAEAENKDAVPTCRSSDMPYTAGVNYTVIVDGFIVSDNIEVISVKNQDTQFAFSDHNPVHMKFSLKGEE